MLKHFQEMAKDLDYCQSGKIWPNLVALFEGSKDQFREKSFFAVWSQSRWLRQRPLSKNQCDQMME